VLDPELGDQETYSKKLKQLANTIPLSDVSLIHKDEVKKADILVEPKVNWCYYYTKAELARQFKEWDQVLLLQKEAAANGFAPNDPFDLLPFIEAHAMTDNINAAKELSMDAIEEDVKTRVGVCKVWERVQAQSPEGSGQESQISDVLNDIQCAK